MVLSLHMVLPAAVSGQTGYGDKMLVSAQEMHICICIYEQIHMFNMYFVYISTFNSSSNSHVS